MKINHLPLPFLIGLSKLDVNGVYVFVLFYTCDTPGLQRKDEGGSRVSREKGSSNSCIKFSEALPLFRRVVDT